MQGKRILRGTVICLMLAYSPDEASGGVPRHRTAWTLQQASAAEQSYPERSGERIEHRQQINQQRCCRAIPQQIHTPTVASPPEPPSPRGGEGKIKESDRPPTPRAGCVRNRDPPNRAPQGTNRSNSPRETWFEPNRAVLPRNCARGLGDLGMQGTTRRRGRGRGRGMGSGGTNLTWRARLLLSSAIPSCSSTRPAGSGRRAAAAAAALLRVSGGNLLVYFVRACASTRLVVGLGARGRSGPYCMGR